MSEQQSEVVIKLIDKTEWAPSPIQIETWQQAYPGIDVVAVLRRFSAWCDANPKNRKTRIGVERAIVNQWLAKEQDKSGRAPVSNFNGKPDPQRPRDISGDEYRHLVAGDEIMRALLGMSHCKVVDGTFRFPVRRLAEGISEKVRRDYADDHDGGASRCFGTMHACVRQWWSDNVGA